MQTEQGKWRPHSFVPHYLQTMDANQRKYGMQCKMDGTSIDPVLSAGRLLASRYNLHMVWKISRLYLDSFKSIFEMNGW